MINPPEVTEADLTTSKSLTNDQQAETWATVTGRRKAIRGSQQVNLGEKSASRNSLLAMSTIKHEPHMDFFVQGIPRLEATTFEAVEEYNEQYKAALTNEGFKVRFVSVFRPKEGDKRGTTSMRIGSFASEKGKLMDTTKWPSNCRVRLWDYEEPYRATQQPSVISKNRA